MKQTLRKLLIIGCASTSILATGQILTSAQTQTPTRTRQAYDARNAATKNPNGKSCDCPYDLNKAGNTCGETSAFIKARGNAPVCYNPNDPALVLQWHRQTKQW